MPIKSMPKSEIIYVPEYSGNREDENPLWVKIKPLSRRESDLYRKQIRYWRKKGFRDQWESNLPDIEKKQFLDHVLEVHNFIDFETGKEITDINRFYNEAPDELITEIFNAILDASTFSEEELKNFKRLAAGQSVASNGTVKAVQKKKEGQEIAD